jgi:hypothetical protein
MFDVQILNLIDFFENRKDFTLIHLILLLIPAFLGDFKLVDLLLKKKNLKVWKVPDCIALIVHHQLKLSISLSHPLFLKEDHTINLHF